MYDRYIVGGVMPVIKSLQLESADELKPTYFLERREMGIKNIGGDALIESGEDTFNIGYREVLYLGKEQKMSLLNLQIQRILQICTSILHQRIINVHQKKLHSKMQSLLF
jgi:5-keto 4-deoxyuronate isomerase